ncbi:hypothetical protein AVEN_114095-1 [Araneus ventricosus]|uniref:Uncharacterized protein n=1 Tax=Araneus ventricosus TaxID=182803 RepID=A0A4Y2UCM8_ARAVE|nr:hypothetical protein AVEN_114095-1 [Araneus ventricosus]
MDVLKQKNATLRSAFTLSANNLELLLAAVQLKASPIEIQFEQLAKRFKKLKDCDIKQFDNPVGKWSDDVIPLTTKGSRIVKETESF